MINVRNVTYSYNHTPVIKGLNYSENEPVITGLWGRNGAGKTTLMSLLAGHYKPDSGSIQVFGQEPYNNLSALEDICCVQENHPFGHHWNMEDLLDFGSCFHKNWDTAFAERLVELFELPRKKKIIRFSKGMKTAAQIILGLASHAKITIMDEPTNGLDAVKRKQFYEAMLNSYEKNPRYILLSTHHIEEIQPLCESLAVVHNGEVLLHEQMDEMRGRGVILSGDEFEIKELTKNVNVLDTVKMRSTLRVMIDEPFSQEWKTKAAARNVSAEPATLQDYLIQITNDKKAVKI
jgi:ABC-2 type transport system ATP-binding protein